MSGGSNTVYVLAVITNFNPSDTKDVTIKARGQAIIHERPERHDITIGTEEIQQQQGGTRNVSTVEIGLVRS